MSGMEGEVLRTLWKTAGMSVGFVMTNLSCRDAKSVAQVVCSCARKLARATPGSVCAEPGRSVVLRKRAAAATSAMTAARFMKARSGNRYLFGAVPFLVCWGVVALSCGVRRRGVGWVC